MTSTYFHTIIQSIFESFPYIIQHVRGPQAVFSNKSLIKSFGHLLSYVTHIWYHRELWRIPKCGIGVVVDDIALETYPANTSINFTFVAQKRSIKYHTELKEFTKRMILNELHSTASGLWLISMQKILNKLSFDQHYAEQN